VPWALAGNTGSADCTQNTHLADDECYVAWRWFTGLGFDREIPHHSTFSKNRHGRFQESRLFEELLRQIVLQCVWKWDWCRASTCRSMAASWTRMLRRKAVFRASSWRKLQWNWNSRIQFVGIKGRFNARNGWEFKSNSLTQECNQTATSTPVPDLSKLDLY
jgi:hypothetical protein